MIGDNIHNIRMMRGLTLSELAERAQISKSYLSNIERNLNQNPSIQIVEKIAHVLGVDVRTLLGTRKIYLPSTDDVWIEFINELKGLGVKKDELETYKTIIEFAKWKKENTNERK